MATIKIGGITVTIYIVKAGVSELDLQITCFLKGYFGTQPCPSFTYHRWLLLHYNAELNSCTEISSTKPKYLLFVHLNKKSANLWLREKKMISLILSNFTVISKCRYRL